MQVFICKWWWARGEQRRAAVSLKKGVFCSLGFFVWGNCKAKLKKKLEDMKTLRKQFLAVFPSCCETDQHCQPEAMKNHERSLRNIWYLVSMCYFCSNSTHLLILLDLNLYGLRSSPLKVHLLTAQKVGVKWVGGVSRSLLLKVPRRPPPRTQPLARGIQQGAVVLGQAGTHTLGYGTAHPFPPALL